MFFSTLNDPVHFVCPTNWNQWKLKSVTELVISKINKRTLCLLELNVTRTNAICNGVVVGMFMREHLWAVFFLTHDLPSATFTLARSLYCSEYSQGCINFGQNEDTVQSPATLPNIINRIGDDWLGICFP